MRRERLVLIAVLGGALALRVALALVIAPFQGPDEAAHLRYVETVGATGRLPIEPPLTWGLFGDDRHQYYQPPLAYLLFVPLERIVAATGATRPRRLMALRIANAVCGAATVAVGYVLAARLTAPGDVRRILVAALIAFFPGFVTNSSVVNNDALANLLAAVLWLPLVASWPGRHPAAWAPGAVFGAACLAKLSVLALAPLLLVVPLLERWPDFSGALRRAAVAGAIAAAVMLPWMVRNYLLYGDPLAIGVGSMSFSWLATVRPAETVSLLARPQPGRAFVQFWGQFGIYNNLSWNMVPMVLVPFTALGLLGWLRPRAGSSGEPFAGVSVACAAAVILAAVGLVFFSLRYYGAWQGRYLYTAMLPLAMLLSGGWERWLPSSARCRFAFAVLVIVALVALDVGIALKLHRFFATVPPLRWGFATAL